ncbi:unnamed protein product [Closterium sp. Yama58-4]|nr:unnamed protein product [Closterium sp. Yama58-4]
MEQARFRRGAPPETRKQPHRYRSWSRQFSVVELRDLSFSLHSRALSSIIAVAKTAVQYRSWSRQFSVVELRDQSFSLHSRALSSIIAAPRRKKQPRQYRPETRKQPHRFRSWSRQVSVVELRDQSFSLHSPKLSSIIVASRGLSRPPAAPQSPAASRGLTRPPVAPQSPAASRGLPRPCGLPRPPVAPRSPAASRGLPHPRGLPRPPAAPPSPATSAASRGPAVFCSPAVSHGLPRPPAASRGPAVSRGLPQPRGLPRPPMAPHPETRKQPHRYRSWSRQFSVVELRDQSFLLHSRALSSIIAGLPETRKQPHRYRSWSRQFSVVELRDQSFLLHSRALSSIIAGLPETRKQPHRYRSWSRQVSVMELLEQSPETRKQPHRYRSMSRQVCVVELRDQSFSLHSRELSSIIIGPPKTRKQPHQYMSWSRQFSAVELRDQSFLLYSQALSSIIAARRHENSRTGTGHGAGNFPSWRSPRDAKTTAPVQVMEKKQISIVELRDQSFSLHSLALSIIMAGPSWSKQFSVVELRDQSFSLHSRALSSIIGVLPETRKQPHRYMSRSRQVSVVELHDPSFSLHSQELSSIIAGTFQHNSSPETRKQPHRYRSWSRQFSVVELRDQSFLLHSRALSSIIAGTFQHNRSSETRKQPHRYRSWSRQFSVVELHDQSFSLHSEEFSSIIAAPRRKNIRTEHVMEQANFHHGAPSPIVLASLSGTFQHNRSPETRKQPHRYRSWSRQFSVVELRDQSFSLHSRALSSIIAVSVVQLRDQSFSLHSRALSSIIAASRHENSRYGTDHGAGNFPFSMELRDQSPETRKQPHRYRSWNKLFSVVELHDQLFSLHSRALSSIIAGPPETRKQPHRYRSWSRQFSVVELRDQSFSLHSQKLFSIIAGPSWNRQVSIMELRDQSFSLHSQALSSIIVAPRRENSRFGTCHGADKFPSWSSPRDAKTATPVQVMEQAIFRRRAPLETRKQLHRYRSWCRQIFGVELHDQSFSLYSRALSSIIAGPLETRKQPHRYRSWSSQVSVVELRDQSFLLHSRDLFSIIAAPRRENSRTGTGHGAGNFPSWSSVTNRTFQHNCSPETRKQPHRYRSWSRQFSVVELRDQSFSLHSQELSIIIQEMCDQSFSLHSQKISSIIAAPRRENSGAGTGHEAGNFPSWSSPRDAKTAAPVQVMEQAIFRRGAPPETRKQPHRYRSWSRQFSVVELRDQSFSLHSRALSSIIAAPRRENSRTGTGHGAGNFPSWSSVTNRSRFTLGIFPAYLQPQRLRSWSRQFSVVELRDQSFSLHSRALSSIIAALRRENSRPVHVIKQTIFRRGAPQFSVVELRDQSFSLHSQALSSINPELRDQSFSLHSEEIFSIIAAPRREKQPHRYMSWSRQFSVVELHDQLLSHHSRAIYSIITGTFQRNPSPETPKHSHRYRSWSRQVSVVEPRDQSFSLHSQELPIINPELFDQSFSLHSQKISSIIAGPPETRKQPHRYRSWSRQFSVVELRDQSFSLHSRALSSIIAGPPETRKQPHRYRSWSRQFSVVELRDQSPETRKQPHQYRSWSRQVSVLELRDQQFSLHSQELSSIIEGTFQHNCSPETRKQPHRYRSWSRQFSVVELHDQSFSLHSRELSSIIAGPPETRKHPHRYRSWSRQFSVVELRDQSFSLHFRALSSIIAGPPETRKQPHGYRSWSRQFSVVELHDQSFSLHSRALSSIIAAPRRENSHTRTGHGVGKFPSWSSVTNYTFQHNCSPETRKQPHRYRSWSRQFSVVELHDQSISLHSQALSSIIAGPPETRKQPHRYRSWSRQFSVVELRDQLFSLHSRALSSIIAAPRRENAHTDTGHGAGNFPSWSSVTNRTFQHNHSLEMRKQPHRYRSWSRQFSVVELRDQSFSLHSRALSSIIVGPYRSWSMQFSVVELRDQSFSLHSRALSSMIAAPRRENSRTGTGHGAGNFPSWSSMTNCSFQHNRTPETRKQPHRYRSWSRQFSVVELRDQSFSLHSRALSSIIAGSPETRKHPHRYKSWSRQFSVVELHDQSFSLHSQELSSIIAGPPETRKQPHRYRSWSRQFSVVELRDQSFSLHSRALSSIIAAPRRENSHTRTGHGAGKFPSWSSVTNQKRSFQAFFNPETRKQPHRYRSWSRQFSVVELRDQSFSLHSQALSSIIAAPRRENSRTDTGHGAGNFPPWSSTRKQPHRYRSWSRQFSVVELRNKSFSLHSWALSSIIAGNFQHNCSLEMRKQPQRYRSWSRQVSVVELRDQFPETRKQPHRYRSWSRQVSVVELRDQSFSLHSQEISSIIAAPPETRKQPHRYRSWSRQVSVVELRDQLFSLHSQELSSIIIGYGAGNFPSWSSVTNRSRFTPSSFQHSSSPETRKQAHLDWSWSRQVSVVELRDQSFSLHSQEISSIIAAPRRENSRTGTGHGVGKFPSWSSVTNSPRRENSRTGLGHGAGNFLSWSSVTNRSRFTPITFQHNPRSWSRQFSVVELRDQSFSPHFPTLSSIIASPPWSRKVYVVKLRDQSFSLHSRALSSIIAGPLKTRKHPHRYRSWSRQVSVVELRDQSFSFHSQELSSIIVPRDVKTAAQVQIMEQTIFRRGAPPEMRKHPHRYRSWSSPETRKHPHRYRSWSRQFSVVELRNQLFSLHSRALSNIIAGPSETRKQPHRYRSWSRQFSVVEFHDQSFSLHSRTLSSINAGPSWSSQFSVVELRDQSFSLHSTAVSSIIIAPRRENSRTDTGHGAGNFPSWSSVTNRSRFTPRHQHNCRSWSRQVSVVELRDQSFLLHSHALHSIIAGPPETRKQPHRYRSWSTQVSVVGLHDQLFSLHSQALSSIIDGPPETRKQPHRYRSCSRQDSVVELRDQSFSLHSQAYSKIIVPRDTKTAAPVHVMEVSVVELRDQSFSLHSRELSSIIAAPRRQNSRADTSYGAGNFPPWSFVTNFPGTFQHNCSLEMGKQPHRYRSWSRQFSVMEILDQSFLLQSHALSSIIAGP